MCGAYIMGKRNLKDDLKSKYGLTGMEVDDILRYVSALCKEFQLLALIFKSEHLIELQNHHNKSKQNKTEKNIFLKAGKSVFNRLSMPAKKLSEQYSKTHKARDLVLVALKAHKISGDTKSVITDILSLMSEHKNFKDDERVITGRRAYESLSDANIGA